MCRMQIILKQKNKRCRVPSSFMTSKWNGNQNSDALILKLQLLKYFIFIKYLLIITSLNYINILEILLLGLIQLPNEKNIFPPYSQGTFSVNLKTKLYCFWHHNYNVSLQYLIILLMTLKSKENQTLSPPIIQICPAIKVIAFCYQN